MKKLLSMLLVLCMALMALPALAQSTDAPGANPALHTSQTAPVTLSTPEPAKTLAAHGSATVSVKPDYATLQVGVVTKKEKVDEAQEENARLTEAIIAAVEAAGVAKEDIVTSSFSLNAVYDYQYSRITETQVLSGYQVENMLEITVRSVEQISQVLDACMTAGANQSYGIAFHSSQERAASDQALKDAVAEGMRRAKLMAAAAGYELGEMLSVEENAGGYSGAYAAAKTMEAAADSTPILAGEVTVSAHVTVTYALK